MVDFLVPILPHLTWATPPHSGFIVFSSSAAGVAIPARLDRFFPINMFAIIDDFTAELNSCRSPLSNSVHHPEPCTIASLLGSIRSAEGDTTHANADQRRYDNYQSNLLTDEPLEDTILRNLRNSLGFPNSLTLLFSSPSLNQSPVATILQFCLRVHH